MILVYLGICISLLLSSMGYAADSQPTSDTLQQPPVSKMTVELKNPSYSEGVLSTEQGGIISGAGIRIQAMRITYCQKDEEATTPEAAVSRIIAEGNLMMEFGDYIFIGERLEYDFKTRSGVIYRGVTMVEPWYFGGEYVELRSDGTYYIYNAFVTTSETAEMDWLIDAKELELTPCYDFTAHCVKLRIFGVPVFWLPSFQMNLNSILDSPVRYSVRWGSRQGHRFGLIYEVFAYEGWKAFLRLDYRIKRGLGGGIETQYESNDGKTEFQSINYVARDSSLIHPGQRLRYRFQGIGDSLLMDDKISIHLSYDKLSDIDMPSDYNDRGLELDTAGRTELLIRRQEETWISNFTTRLRINNFQTIKQELPTFETSWHPFELETLGIIGDNYIKGSYLNFAYGNNQLNVHDYSSTRLELSPTFYRPFIFNWLNVTPEVGATMVAYGNSPHRQEAKWLTIGQFSCNANTNIQRMYGCHFKHVISPYTTYNYCTMPTVSPTDHYIFDIEDGLYRLNMLQLGIAQNLYQKNEKGYIRRRIYADIYTQAFFGTPTISETIPKIYGSFIFNTFSFLSHSINTAWNFSQNEIDYYNVRTEWTVNANIAVAAEYRHRSPYDWRKADHTNFILDSFRSASELRDSQLSDRRDTLLLHFFYRFHPDWALEFESRSGWNREFEPSYNEFEIDLLGTLRSAWNIKLSYQHREDDDRVSFYTSIGINRPDCRPSCSPPLLGF